MFVNLWLRRAFTRSISLGDLAGSLIGNGINVFLQFNPDYAPVMKDLIWQIPVYAMAGAMAYRLLIAPYELWKEAGERANAAPARDFEDSPKIKFDTFIQELRHLATSRELWRAQVNSRNRDDRKMYEELEKVVNDIRRLFPPSATFNVEDDPFTKLFSSAARFGEQTGYAQPGRAHGEKEWVEFEDQLHRITNLFESNSQRQIK